MAGFLRSTLVLCLGLSAHGGAIAQSDRIKPPAAVRAMMLKDIKEGWEREKELSSVDLKAVLLRVDVGTSAPVASSEMVYDCQAKEVYRTSAGVVAAQDWASQYARQGRRWARVVAMPAG